MAILRSSRVLERKLQRFFSESSILRGEGYYHDRAVMSARVGEPGATAEVIGTDIYRVSLDWSQVEGGFLTAIALVRISPRPYVQTFVGVCAAS